jgi:hypothetical protein
LGTYGDEAVLAEARRRFALFVKAPSSLATDLRGPVANLVGRYADPAAYDTLLALGRKTTNTEERVRYYSAAAGALDLALARESACKVVASAVMRHLRDGAPTDRRPASATLARPRDTNMCEPG